MNQLVSMVVPLETLPGWPVAPPVSWLHAIGLLLGLPLLVIIIISTIGKVGEKRSENRSDAEERAQLGTGGAGGGSSQGGSIDGRSESAALPAGGSDRGRVEDSTAVEADAKVGGASARW